jgi:Na+-driven multidrug efflux pump
MTREAVADQILLFRVVVALPFLIIAAFCLLQLIRWINSEPEVRHIRLLWIGLWSSGGGFLLLGIIMLKQVVPQLLR